MKSKKVLVTSGAGFIGTNLVHELQSRGHDVLAADLYNTERDHYIRADVRNYRQLEQIFRRIDLIMTITLQRLYYYSQQDLHTKFSCPDY